MPIGPFRTYTQPVNVSALDRFDDGAEVTLEALAAAGLIRTTRKDVKILGKGDLAKKLTVTAHAFSATAREKIEAAGGTVVALREPQGRGPEGQAEAQGRHGTPTAGTRADAPPRRRPQGAANLGPCSPGSPTRGACRSCAAACSSRRSSC